MIPNYTEFCVWYTKKVLQLFPETNVNQIANQLHIYQRRAVISRANLTALITKYIDPILQNITTQEDKFYCLDLADLKRELSTRPTYK